MGKHIIIPSISALLSFIIFASWGLIVNFYNVPMLVITCIFGFSGFIFLLPIGLKYNSLKDLLDVDIAVISVVLIADIYVLGMAYRNMSFGIVTSLHYLGPLLAAVFAPIFVKEKFNGKIFAYIVAAFLGVILMSFHMFWINGHLTIPSNKNLYGLFLSVLSGFTLAGDLLFQNRFMKSDKTNKKSDNKLIAAAAGVFKYNLYIFLILIIPSIYIIKTSSNLNINYVQLFFIGIAIQGVAMTMVNFGSCSLPVNLMGLYGYTEIFWSAVFGIVFLGQHFFILELIGGFIMVYASYKGFLIYRKEVANGKCNNDNGCYQEISL